MLRIPVDKRLLLFFFGFYYDSRMNLNIFYEHSKFNYISLLFFLVIPFFSYFFVILIDSRDLSSFFVTKAYVKVLISFL